MQNEPNKNFVLSGLIFWVHQDPIGFGGIGRIRLLSAAFRNHMHWSELIGGDIVISPPYTWQRRFNASDIEVRPRIQNRVDPKIVEELEKKFVDFRRAYSENGLSVEEFDSFAPTRRTLRQFIAACSELEALVRDFLLPSPDA